MDSIFIGKTAERKTVSLPLKFGNRHGLVTGSTGTGKTVTLQLLAEGFSRAGVPVFAADIKGDLSGLAKAGPVDGRAADRAAALETRRDPQAFPVRFWDVMKRHGLPVQTSVDRIGQLLMARMLNCNPTQDGSLSVAFASYEDRQGAFLDLEELRDWFSWMLSERADFCRDYGNITAASLSAIQREILTLEIQGGANLFAEPGLDIMDLMRVAEDGRGVINLLHADNLMESPRLYASLLMWLLTELFRVLPEAGDLAKPKLVFFFDEAHLLFRDAPPKLLETIERVVRLVRSKGVGVFFVTQSPADVPDAVLAQLGNRIQHTLRAYTPKDQRMVKASAKAFRPNKGVDVQTLITSMGLGEALISCLVDDGVPAPVERIKVMAPSAQIGPITEEECAAIIEADPLREKYKAPASREEMIWEFDKRIALERGWPEPGRPLTEDESRALVSASIARLAKTTGNRTPFINRVFQFAGVTFVIGCLLMAFGY